MNHQSVKPAVLLDIGIDFFSQVLEVGRCQGAHWRNNQDTLVLEQLTLNHIRHSAVVEGDIYRLLSFRGTIQWFPPGADVFDKEAAHVPSKGPEGRPRIDAPWSSHHSLPGSRLHGSIAERATGGISPETLDALKRMGKTLSAKQFLFQSWTFRGYAGPNGELLHIAHTSKIIYRRPDRLSISVTGDDGTIKILYDGTALVLYGAEQKQYVSLPVTGGIDKALDLLEERTGTDFPLSDLLSDDPGEAVASGVTSGGQVGTSTIDGVRCNHFFFVQALDDLELELWLEDNEGALPRRFVVTYRSLPGRPIFVADLSGWDFSIQTPDSAFVFQPPPGVTQVELKASAATAPPK